MEVYSPPRVGLAVQAKKLTAQIAVDILTGFDLCDFVARRSVMDLLQKHKPLCLLVSPPCTMYSQLQALFNLHNMPPETLRRRWAEAHLHLDFSMHLCQYQAERNRFFIFEHPWRASSWERESVKRVAELANCHKVTFDQCQTGLTTPDDKKTPIKKRTSLLTNCKAVTEIFEPLQCQGCAEHHHIEGSINGIRLSHWCQIYTPQLCEKFAEVVKRTAESC